MPLGIDDETRLALEDNLLLFFTGFSRAAGGDPEGPGSAHRRRDDAAMIDNLHYVKDLGLRSKEALEAQDLIAFGKLMHEHWQHKQALGRNVAIRRSTNGTILALKTAPWAAS